MFQSISQDARYAVRLFLKQPGFTAVAMLTLALGIGGSAAIFTVVNAVVIEALPYPDSDRLVVLWERAPAGGRNSVSPAMFGDWAAEGALFEGLAARQGRAFVLSGGGAPEQVPGALVTPGYFDVFGVRLASGRGFTDEDAAAGNAVVVTRRFAQRHLAGDEATGRTLRLDGEPHVIVGVLPEGSFDRGGPEIYRAASVPVEERRFRYLTVMGRLRDGVSVAQAESRLQAIAAAAAIQHPETNRDWGALVEPLRDRVIGASLRQTALLLFMGAIVVLLIACANVASLTLARAAGRGREMAVRTALGAGRARLVRQLLTESLVLGAAGGLLGVVGAVWAVRALVAILPQGLLPAEVGLEVDAQVLAFAAAASIGAGLFCGLAPAVRAGGRSVADAVRGAGRGATAGAIERRFGDVLVAGELAVTVVLVVSAGLLAATLLRLERVDPGFEADGVLTWRLTVPARTGESPEAWRARTRVYLQTALERLSQLPGTEAAAVVSDLPVGDGWSIGVRYRSALTPQEGTPTQQFAHLQRISAGFFDALRVPLRAGRAFTEADREGAERVVIVNETLARRAFGGRDPIGQVLHLSTGRQTDEDWRVVGVAGDVKIESLADPDDSRAEVYVPYLQNPSGNTAFGLRTSGRPMALAQAVRELFRELDGDLPLTRMMPLDGLVGGSVAVERFRSRFVGAFAIVAIVLAVVGIYGVRAFTVRQRYRELGIRLALGAPPRDIVRLVAGQGLALSIAGLIVGGAAALYTGRAMSALLFGVEGGDPAILSAGLLAVVAAAALAGYIPSRRAARIDPAIVLRVE